MRFWFWLAVLFAVSTPFPAMADVRVDAISGTILINRGTGYAPIDQPRVAYAGEMLMARRGGSARLVYEDGCTVPVEANTVVVVQDRSPCASANPALETSEAVFGMAAALSSIVVIPRIDRAPISP